MNEEQMLRERLDQIEVPASTLGMETLLPRARKRATRRKVAGATAGAAVVAGVLLVVPLAVARTGAAPVVRPAVGPVAASTAAHTTPAACRLVELPVPAGLKYVGATAVDPSGRYIVGNGLVKQDFRPVLWTDGKAEALPVDADSVQVTGVNAAGTVVGIETVDNLDHPFRYENGVYTRLKLPKGQWNPYPYPALNAGGDILMNAEPLGNSGGKDSIVLLWKAGTSTPVKVPLPKGANGHALADDGTIVGSVYRDGSAVAAYAWDQTGQGRKLKTPAGLVTAGYAVGGDWATGGLWEPVSAARWNLRTGEMTVTKADGPGDAVNAAGWVVASGGVWRDGTKIDLSVPRGKSGAATDVSDTGLIVGQVTDPMPKDRKMANTWPRAWQCPAS